MKSLKNLYNAAGYDYKSAIARTSDDEEMLKKLLKALASDDSWEKMFSTVERGETEEAFRAAHSLKGSTGMLGLSGLYEAIKELTEELRAGNICNAKKYLPDVKQKYGKLIALCGEINQIENGAANE